MPKRRAKQPPRPSPRPTRLRDLAPDERPRERLLRSGGASLSNAEVLSVVLGNGASRTLALLKLSEADERLQVEAYD